MFEKFLSVPSVDGARRPVEKSDGAKGQALKGHALLGASLILLSGCGGGGSDTGPAGVRRPATVTNAPPTAHAVVHRGGGHGPFTVSADGSSSTDPETTPLDYRWDFGDGAQATGVAATHTYAEPGSYSIVLRVSDAGGATDTTRQTVVIEAEDLACAAPL